nr:hypothetical protein [Arcicella sp.]
MDAASNHWLLVGTFTFLQKEAPIESTKVSLDNRFLSFLKGISLSLFNPALLPFWLVVLLSYKKYSYLIVSNNIEKSLFVLGAGTGTFLLVYTYAFVADTKRDLIFKYVTDTRL